MLGASGRTSRPETRSRPDCIPGDTANPTLSKL
jgi:hypothetical protein